ncbi:hypothetical protein A6U84_21325 [Agrobacterium sp. 13-2099-1-2]|jgi:hypothetical protein|uniref:hypothetical protein n=1 Tax=Agrobacterium sp. 13-2099-1-2 TaxID=1841651 RepID=UPI00080F7779|nr:hypothetical protein [Agrobacterium sp. 13-2099-1-2]UZX44593.1 hypothetical protein A6U84_21325 [Agrobacterium sp. 13-2099-1-2]
MTQIIISGDLTRVNDRMELHQSHNIAWFSRLFTPIFQSLGFKVYTVGEKKNDFPLNLLHDSIYDQTSRKLHDQWAARYDAGFPTAFVKELVDAFGPATFFLFEASPAFMESLDSARMVYLNFRVHPIRFASDLIFAIKTNDKNVALRLKQFAMKANFLKREVELCQRRWRTSQNVIPAGSTIFMAQTNEDASLIENGRFLRISDFSEMLRREIDSSRAIFYKRHPHVRYQESFDFWQHMFPDTKEVPSDISAYELFCQSKDLRIATISSGSAYEAKLFGHSTLYLSGRHWGADFYRDYVPITHEYWYPEFWRNLFETRGIARSWIQTITRRGINAGKLPFVENRLKGLINFEWSKP